MDKKNLGFTKQQLQYIDELERIYTRRISSCCEALERARDYQKVCEVLVDFGIVSERCIDALLAGVSEK